MGRVCIEALNRQIRLLLCCIIALGLQIPSQQLIDLVTLSHIS